MNIIQVIILGFVEGVTEFLPISSTFHLIFASKVMGISQNNEFVKLFEVFIQAGAILSVLILYFRELWQDRELAKKVLVSFIPTATIGFVFYKLIKGFFESDMLMLSVFVAVGILFIVAERLFQQNKADFSKEVKQLSYKDAIIIGFAQTCAVVPGVSRAGSVILGMMFLRYNRADAAKYSFMLSIPTIFAASFYDLYKSRDVLLNQGDGFFYLLVGAVAAFISSYIVVKWFIGYLKHHSLEVFGWYRILLAIIIVLMMFTQSP